jgi:hypothetical protein
MYSEAGNRIVRPRSYQRETSKMIEGCLKLQPAEAWGFVLKQSHYFVVFPLFY